jgi:hypothetical protein
MQQVSIVYIVTDTVDRIVKTNVTSHLTCPFLMPLHIYPQEPSVQIEVKEVQAFLAEDDVGENWLEDDMVSTSRPKKRRRLGASIEKHRCVGTKTGLQYAGTIKVLCFKLS